MEKIIFDALKNKYPIGAIKTNSPVLLNISLHQDIVANGLCMVLRQIDEPLGKKYYFEKTKLSEQYQHYSLTFNIDKEGIYYYRFEIETDNGIMFVGSDKLLRAKIQDFLPEWQLTVTKNDYKVPNERKNNITYQIFVDRFNKGKDIEFKKFGVQKQWNEPLTIMDSDGIYRANDFYGGNLKGITNMLDYIKSLGVKNLYLSPIFESQSNHRYDTADYEKIDSYLGDESDFEELISEAKKRDIGVMLDGVFNHTGADSVYFNKFGHYNSLGAYQSQNSPYYDWYNFTSFPDEYACWWGCTVVPTVTNKASKSYNDLIFNKVIDKWTKMGISGWRLDVVDELPEFFVDKIRSTVKKINSNAVVIGEVWEDASTKVSYGTRRPYLLGDQLDGTMNYPFKDAIIGYLLSGNITDFWSIVSSIVNNYPTQSLETSLTMLDSHDTFRILNTLADVDVSNMSKQDMQNYVFTKKQYDDAKELLKLGVVLQYFLIGSPTVFYGDEQGTLGFADPLSRPTFNKKDSELYNFYCLMGRLHEKYDIFDKFVPEYEHNMVVFNRQKGEKLKVIVNNSGEKQPYIFSENYTNVITNEKYSKGCQILVNNKDFLLLINK